MIALSWTGPGAASSAARRRIGLARRNSRKIRMASSVCSGMSANDTALRVRLFPHGYCDRLLLKLPTNYPLEEATQMEPKTITKEWAKEPIKLGPPRRVYAASTPFDYVKWADSMQEAVKKCHASSKQPLVSIASYTTIAAADEPTGLLLQPSRALLGRGGHGSVVGPDRRVSQRPAGPAAVERGSRLMDSTIERVDFSIKIAGPRDDREWTVTLERPAPCPAGRRQGHLRLGRGGRRRVRRGADDRGPPEREDPDSPLRRRGRPSDLARALRAGSPARRIEGGQQ